MSHQDQFDTMMETQELAENTQGQQDNLQPVMGMDVEDDRLHVSPSIVVKQHETTVSEHALTTFPVLIGRKNHNHIILDEKNVSREHAEIVLKDDQYFICDKSSTGGTRVNHESVKEKDIHTGDTIEIGSFKLLFNSGIPEDERTIFDADDCTILENGTEMDEDRTRFGHETLARLSVLHSNSLAGDLDLNPNTTLLGRDQEADISVNEHRVSRQHCKIHFSGTDYLLTDLGSANGTFVNDKRVTDVILQHGDEIQIGSSRFKFQLDTYAAPDQKRKGRLLWPLLAGLCGLSLLFWAGYRWIPGWLPPAKQKVILQKLWEKPLYADVTVSPALGDVNGDGQIDVITADIKGVLYAMDTRQGGSLWNSPLDTQSGMPAASPLLADINEKDGQLDVIMATQNRNLWTINGSNRKYIWNGRLNSPASGTPAAADVNDDGIDDLIAASQAGLLICFDGRQGGIIWQADLQARLDTAPKLADLNDDGCSDVILGGSDFNVHAFNGKNGQLLWVHAGTAAPSTAALKDMNHDGTMDVVIATPDHLLAIEGEKGALLWKWAIHRGGTKQAAASPLTPAIADLNRDKIPDVILTDNSGHLYAIDGASQGRSYLWDFGLHPTLKTAPALYDFNQDRVPDILIGDALGNVLILNGINGHLLNQFQTSGPITAMPVIADLNGNKTADIILGTQNQSLIALETETRCKKNQIIWNSY